MAIRGLSQVVLILGVLAVAACAGGGDEVVDPADPYGASGTSSGGSAGVGKPGCTAPVCGESQRQRARARQHRDAIHTRKPGANV